MAENNDELDLDSQQAAGGKGKIKKIILLSLLAIILIGGSVGGTIFFLSGDSSAPAKEEPKAAKAEEPIYLELDTMTVNFGTKGPAKFLQVDMQVMAFDSEPLDAIEKHMPVIRNNILMILASQSYESVSTREGKEALRAELVADINTVLNEQAKLETGIEQVYFTSFVMQ